MITKKYRFYFLVLIYIFFISGSILYTTTDFKLLFYLFTAFAIFLSLLISVKTKNSSLNLFFITFLFLFISLILSALFNNSSKKLIDGIGFSLVIASVVFFLPNIIKDTNQHFALVYKCSIWVIFPILFLSLYVYGFIKAISVGSVIGIFTTSNGYGLAAEALYSVLFPVSFMSFMVYKRKYYLILIILSFLLVLISSSRNAIIASMLITFLVATHYYRNRFDKFLQLILYTIPFILIFFDKIFFVFKSYFLDKFERKSDDLFDQRTIVWNTILENVSFFGNSDEFIENLPLAIHSTYFSFLTHFGIIPTLLFACLLFIILIRSIYYLKSDSIYKYVPISLFISFVITSFTEGMLMKYQMIFCFVSYGIILLYKRPNCNNSLKPIEYS